MFVYVCVYVCSHGQVKSKWPSNNMPVMHRIAFDVITSCCNYMLS